MRLCDPFKFSPSVSEGMQYFVSQIMQDRTCPHSIALRGGQPADVASAGWIVSTLTDRSGKQLNP